MGPRHSDALLGELSRHILARKSERPLTVPFIIGIAGGVAAGKSTFATALAEALEMPQTPTTVSTDNFLRPNADLQAAGLMARKGFPESYDQAALSGFLREFSAGAAPLDIPLYSHGLYDIVPGSMQRVDPGPLLIVEGLNILQPGLPPAEIFTYLDWSIYLDAEEAVLEAWFIGRFEGMLEDVLLDPDKHPGSHLSHFAKLPRAKALARARAAWAEINLPNLRRHILPTRDVADAIVRKSADHTIVAIDYRS